MASGGPTQDNTALYKQIIAAKGPEKEAMMKALSPTQKREFVKLLQAVQGMRESEKRVEKLHAVVKDCDAREAALASEDKSILVKASGSYAQSVGSVPSQTPVHTGSASTPRYGSKFNQ